MYQVAEEIHGQLKPGMSQELLPQWLGRTPSIHGRHKRCPMRHLKETK